MKTVWTLGVIGFIVPSLLIGIAGEYKTACVQQKGHGYLSATYSSYSSNEFWNHEGTKRDAHNDFEKKSYSLYGEFGLTKRDTISAQGSWARVDESINGRTFGFEDIELGWKHYLGTKWCHHISTELVGIVPIETEHQPGLRYGEFGGEFNLLFTRGLALWKRCGGYDLRLGYRAYTGFPSDQVRADAVFHIFPFSRLKLSAGGFLEYGLFNGHSRHDQSHFLLNSNYRLFKAEVKASLRLYRGASAFVGYNRHLWGRNVGTRGGYFGGVQVQF